MRLRATARWTTLLLPLTLLAAGCHPGSVEDVAELDLVVTWHDPAAEFGVYVTYALADTIYDLAELEDPTHESDLDRRHDEDILAQVAAGFDALGYLRVDPDVEEPDLRVGVGATTREGTAFYSYYPWWGYDSSYPWYPAVGSVDFTAGSLFLLLADWENRDPEAETVPLLWMGAAQGVIESSAMSMAERIERAIDQMFSQSPYLGATPEVTR